MEKIKHVKIFIDNQIFQSPDPTTGAALYVLGAVNSATHDLWLKVPGKKDDEIVPNTSDIYDLKNREKFYTAQKNLNPGYGRS